MQIKVVNNGNGICFEEISSEDVKSTKEIILNEEDIKTLIKLYEGNLNFPKSLEEIAQYVCDICGITIKNLKSKCRKSEYVIARQIYCYTAVLTHSYSYEKIGWLIRKDHSTVSHSILVCENCLKYKYLLMYDKLKNVLIHFKLWEKEFNKEINIAQCRNKLKQSYE